MSITVLLFDEELMTNHNCSYLSVCMYVVFFGEPMTTSDSFHPSGRGRARLPSRALRALHSVAVIISVVIVVIFVIVVGSGGGGGGGGVLVITCPLLNG